MNSSFNESSAAPHSGPAPHVPYVLEPEGSKMFRFVIYGIIFLLAVLGNITVCILPFRHRRLRSFTYYLITNLAVADIGAMLCLPYILIAEWNGGVWMMGYVMCKLVNPSLTMFFVITTNTLVAIAVDRFIAMVFPFRLRPGKRSSFLVIVLTWLVAFLCVLPSFGARVLHTYQQDSGTLVSCEERFPTDSEEANAFYLEVYTICMYLINNLIPVLLIVILYLVITVRLKGFRSSHHLYSRNYNLSAVKKKEARERKFTRMLAVVVLVFVIFYVPYQTFFLVAIVNWNVVASWKYFYIGYKYLYLLMWVPNALNPICYGSMDAQYARAFKALLRCTSKSQRFLRDRISSVGSSYQSPGPRNGGYEHRTEDFAATETVNVNSSLPRGSPTQIHVCVEHTEDRTTEV